MDLKKLPRTAKRLISTELSNITEVRKKIKHFFYGTVAGSAFQLLRLKQELEEALARELLSAKVAARRAGIIRIPSKIYIPESTPSDIVSAHIAAGSFANLWASAALANLPMNIDDRITKIITTETSRSFSDVVREASSEHKLVRRWNSILDEKVCKKCASMDGLITQPGMPFEGGIEPGWVHPRCRCYSDLILKG